MKLPMTIAVHFFMSFAFAGGNIATVFVEGMSCPACAAKVEKQLKKFPEVESVDIALDTGKTVLVLKPGEKSSQADIKSAVEDAVMISYRGK